MTDAELERKIDEAEQRLVSRIDRLDAKLDSVRLFVCSMLGLMALVIIICTIFIPLMK